MYSVQIQVSHQHCNLYVSLRFSTGADKLKINTDKPTTNNSNSAELPKQLPHR